MTTPIAKNGTPIAAQSTANVAERAKMQAVAKQFEAVFLRQMIGSMRQADLAEGVFDSSATGQFRDMADSKTADSMAETGGFGIASMMMRQFDAQHKIVTPPAVDSGK